MRPVYEHRITKKDVGQRVSVRRWVEDEERGRVPSDVVGRLITWDDDVLRVEKRNGAVVAVEESTILASKTIPEPPSKR